MSRSYEELMGSVGKSRFFRPERRKVRDLLSRDAQPKLLIGGTECKLFDVSMNGLSFVSDADLQRWPVNGEFQVTLMLNEQELYRGLARVARTELDSRGARIAMALSTGFIDLPELRRRGEEARLDTAIRMGPHRVRSKVPAPFREVVDEAVYFAQHYKRALDDHEARHRAAGPAGRDELPKLAERALESIREPWKRLGSQGSIVALQCLSSSEALRAAKEYTETALTPLLLDAPMIRRSYTKPLGYPGDYQVMIYYYNNAFEGDSVFGQVFHKLFMEQPLPNGVRTRCDYVVGLMEEQQNRVVARKMDDAIYRVTSLGCGPARESALFARKRRDWPGQAVWTLIDQEEETLSVAFHDTQVELARSGARGQVRCLNVSFAQLFGDVSSMPGLEPQDLIFSTGLFDYLRETRAQELLLELYGRLAPGGLLAIGNAASPNDHFWEAEFILDWTLLYRTKEEMLRLADKIPRPAEIDVTLEPGNAYYFLLVRKPG
jgi:trans-aconitate methyltransferase